ncbi:transposase [Streptomyces mirabilis]
MNHQNVSQAVVVTTGITKDSGRGVLGLMVGDSETEAVRSEFLRSMRERGLAGSPWSSPITAPAWAKPSAR